MHYMLTGNAAINSQVTEICKNSKTWQTQETNESPPRWQTTYPVRKTTSASDVGALMSWLQYFHKGGILTKYRYTFSDGAIFTDANGIDTSMVELIDDIAKHYGVNVEVNRRDGLDRIMEIDCISRENVACMESATGHILGIHVHRIKI